jgi:hypothetical protein
MRVRTALALSAAIATAATSVVRMAPVGATPLARVESRSPGEDGEMQYLLLLHGPGLTVRPSCPCVRLVPTLSPERYLVRVDCREVPRYVVPGVFLEDRSGLVRFLETPCRR